MAFAHDDRKPYEFIWFGGCNISSSTVLRVLYSSIRVHSVGILAEEPGKGEVSCCADFGLPARPVPGADCRVPGAEKKD